jgi:curli biogenesis system outer membrane secretion channel CsgG
MTRLVCMWGLAGAVTFAAMGCAVIGRDSYYGPKHLDARQPSDFDTPNLESHDLQAACQTAVSRMLASNLLNRVTRTPIFVVEDGQFANESEDAINTQALVDLLRNELVNAGQGRVTVMHPVAEGTPVQADFVVKGRITDVRNVHHRKTEAYTQIALNVVLASTGEVVFSDLYAVKKGASLVPRLY